jgi:hypothetical protein
MHGYINKISMILSEIQRNQTKQQGIDQTQQIQISCDNCHREYSISLVAQKTCFSKYKKDLCRGCQQREQYKNKSRSKDQCFAGGQSAILKMKGKTYEEMYGFEKSKILKSKKSIQTIGKKNPMYGKNYQTKNLNQWSRNNKGKSFEDIYGTTKSLKYKKNISKALSGENNPMFGKPSPNGSGNGWSGWYKGWFFRSLKELSYMINVIERFNLMWINAENSNFRICYYYLGKKRTYVADFIINEKYMIEIKPKKLHQSKLVQIKAKAAINFCNEIGLKYKLIDPIKLLSFNDIKILVEEKKIKFLDKYQSKFELWEN